MFFEVIAIIGNIFEPLQIFHIREFKPVKSASVSTGKS